MPLVDLTLTKPNINVSVSLSLIYRYHHLSRVARKPAFCLCESNDADQLRGNCEAEQCLYFRYIYSTIPLLPKFERSSMNRPRNFPKSLK